MTNDDLKKKAIKDFCNEMSASMTRKSAEQDFQREAIKNISEEQGIDKKILRKMAKVFHESKFHTVHEEQKEFEDMYTGVFGDV